MQNYFYLIHKKLKEKDFIHLFLGIFPSILLFLYSLFLLKVFNRIGILGDNFNYSTSNPISFIGISFLVFSLFGYFIYLAFLELKIRNKKDFYIITFLVFFVSIISINRGPFFSTTIWSYISFRSFMGLFRCQYFWFRK